MMPNQSPEPEDRFSIRMTRLLSNTLRLNIAPLVSSRLILILVLQIQKRHARQTLSPRFPCHL